MTDDETKLWRRFQKDFETGAFPQDVVSSTVAVNVPSLNNWRQRELLSGGWQQAKSHVSYTGEGLVRAGLLGAFAWHFGPTIAAKMVRNHAEFLWSVYQDKEFGFLDTCVFAEPDWDEFVNPPSLLAPAPQTPKLYRTGSLAEIQADTRPRIMAVFPIGHLVAKWGIRAVQIRDKAK